MALKIRRIERTIFPTMVASATSLMISVLRSSSPAPAAGGAPAACASANRGSQQTTLQLRTRRSREPRAPSRRTQRDLRRAAAMARVDSKTRSAPLGQRSRESVARTICAVNHLIRWHFGPMLRFISIRNLAVIDRLEVEFEPGLNVLTGETGAGKSILVGAVGLLVGGRASADLVRTGEEQATVEAVFEDPAGAELMIRRDVSVQSGRSRAFLNGSLVTSAALRELAADLVDLHGQHEHQVLLDPASHLDLLDAFAGLTGEREGVQRGVHPAAVARRGEKPPRDRRPREDTARGIPPLPADRDRARRAPAWRRRRAVNGTPGPRQCRAAAATVRRGLHRTV